MPAILFSGDTALSKKQGQTTAMRETEQHTGNDAQLIWDTPEPSRNKWVKGGQRTEAVGWNYANEGIIQLNCG